MNAVQVRMVHILPHPDHIQEEPIRTLSRAGSQRVPMWCDYSAHSLEHRMPLPRTVLRCDPLIQENIYISTAPPTGCLGIGNAVSMTSEHRRRCSNVSFNQSENENLPLPLPIILPVHVCVGGSFTIYIVQSPPFSQSGCSVQCRISYGVNSAAL